MSPIPKVIVVQIIIDISLVHACVLVLLGVLHLLLVPRLRVYIISIEVIALAGRH